MVQTKIQSCEKRFKLAGPNEFRLRKQLLANDAAPYTMDIHFTAESSAAFPALSNA
jgi:hypothetical protein